MNPRRYLAPAAWLALGGLPAVAIWRLPAPVTQLEWLAAAGPAIVGMNLLLVLACVLRCARERSSAAAAPLPPRERLAALAAPVLLALAMALLAALAPARMRVQSDEYLIAGVSMGLGLQGLPLAPSAGMFDQQGGLAVLSASFDKRGLAVPLLIAIPHRLLGYRLEHAFAFNLAAGWLALCMLYLLLRIRLGRAAALTGALLLAAQPAFAWSVRSISLEPFNLALVLALGAAAHAALAGASASRAWLVLWLAPLAAQARYESALLSAFALPLGLHVLALRGTPARALWPLALVPFAYLPFAWQRAIPLDFQLELASIGADHGFGLDHVVNHALALGRLLAERSPVNPFGAVSLALALAGIGWGALRLARSFRTRAATRAADAVLAGAALALACGILAYAWSDPFQPATLRLMLPILAFLCAAVAGLLHDAAARFARTGGAAILAAPLALALAAPAIRTDRVYERLVLGQALNSAYDRVHADRPQCRYAWVAENATYFLVRGDSALPPKVLDANWERLRGAVASGVLDGVLLERPIDLGQGRFVYDTPVPSGYAAREIVTERAKGEAGFRLDALARPGEPMPAARRADCDLSAWPAAAGTARPGGEDAAQ